MRLLSLALAMALAAPLCTQASSLVLTNVGAEIKLDEDMPIRFRKGEIIVTCKSAEECRPRPIVDFVEFLSPTVSAGINNATLNWNVPGADVCVGWSPAGIAGWTNTPLEKQGRKTFTLSTGIYTFEMRCFAVFGGTTINAPITVR